MSFKPLQRLGYAQELNQSDVSNELHFRCVIHQAYYAALNHMQYEIDNRLFFKVDGDDRVKHSHKALIESCEGQVKKLPTGDSRRKLLMTAVNNMRRAKRMRETADYHMESDIDHISAQSTLRFAEEIFDCIEKYE